MRASLLLLIDLAGFTKWPSTRSAEEVFELLESVYGVFDKLALKLKVFKVSHPALLLFDFFPIPLWSHSTNRL